MDFSHYPLSVADANFQAASATPFRRRRPLSITSKAITYTFYYNSKPTSVTIPKSENLTKSYGSHRIIRKVAPTGFPSLREYLCS